MKLFNTLSRKVEPFDLAQGKDSVGMYSCGPTVYDYAHIGNLRTYVFNDLLKRTLLSLGFKVKHVMNLTDIDDKTIKGSQKENISLTDFTQRYTKFLFEDLKALNILMPDISPKATEHIPEMIKIIQTLLDKGFAYKGQDNSIYFEISKFKDYGKLSGLDLRGLKAGARVAQDEYTKEQASDFALWKAYTPEDGDIYWDSPFGKGRPGWHIECSAMSTKYLGDRFDIHTGAVDLIFPHHENEIAQTEAATGKPGWVRFWIHGEFLLVDNAKMSKSKHNFYRLKDITDKGFSPLAVRYLFAMAHYRQRLNFTWESLEGAQKTLDRLYAIVAQLRRKTGIIPVKTEKGEGFQKEFVAALENDLNLPEAMAVVWEMVKGDLDEGQKLALLLEWDKVLGLNFAISNIQYPISNIKISQEINKLVEEREELRKEGKWEEADNVRKQIEEKGYIIEDTDKGPKVKAKRLIKN